MKKYKQFVLSLYPNACCEKMSGSLYFVYRGITGEIIAEGRSLGSAWKNAYKILS